MYQKSDDRSDEKNEINRLIKFIYECRFNATT